MNIEFMVVSLLGKSGLGGSQGSFLLSSFRNRIFPE